MGPLMCTYTTERCAVEGAGKGPPRWLRLANATVYLDHPVAAMAEHTLNIDLTPAGGTPEQRVGIELTAESALDLVDAIVAAVAAVPPQVSCVDPERLAAYRVVPTGS
jgi:hypothetical protein